jgi:hypothetical protein
MGEVIDWITELWRSIWSFLGPIATVLLIILILYIREPEKFDRIAIHISWALSRASRHFEKSAIRREVKYLITREFIRNFLREEVPEIPEIVVEWGDEDRAYRDAKAGKLVIVLKSGSRNRYENIARALITSIPDLLAPEMKVVYDNKLITCLSAHVARSIAKENQPVVTAINEAIDSLTRDDENLRELASKLVEIDDRSLLSRALIPEIIEIAKLRYPHRDSSIDEEVLNLIDVLYPLARGEVIDEPMVYGKYIRILFVLVARPEKIEAMLEPHVSYVKHVLRKYQGINSIYILAAGKNVVAAKALKMLLENELKSMNLKPTLREYEYEGRYRDAPKMKLYLCRIKIL